MAGPERIMAENIPSVTETPSSTTLSATPTRELPTYRAANFDQNRKDYQTKTIGKDVIFIDSLTGSEVARMPKVEGGSGGSPEVSRAPSTFQQILAHIRELEEQHPSAERDRALFEARQGERNLLDQAERLGLLAPLRAELSGIYYNARVKVTNSAKEGRDDYEGRGKLQELQIRQQAAYNPNTSLERDLQDFRTGDIRLGFWSSPLVKEIERRYAANGNPDVVLERAFGRMIDYFHQKSVDMILDVVKDRKSHTSPADPYSDTMISDLWRGPITDPGGHILKDENGNDLIAVNFDDVRFTFEEARRQEPWVPNRADYETYIRLVADDIEELEEMIPYIVAKVVKKLGTGQPDKLSNKLEQEKEKIDGALANFHTGTAREFRRLKSTLADNLNLMGAYFFSDKVQDDWNPYLSYMNLLATATEDTEQQDHLVDALILDKDGLTMLAVQQFCKEDGIFWRYGQKAANLAREVSDTSKFFRRQVRRRKEINQFLMSNRLRKMSDLLSLEVNDLGEITSYGDPKHPAFQRLKEKLYQLDADDKANNQDKILDADDQPTDDTRWAEYCRKALEWEKTGKFGDPREAERVIFQHPLARVFKPPTKNAAGQIESEFLNMFEEDRQVDSDKWYKQTKRRKVESTIEKAEWISRAFMLDSAAALAWHRVPVKDINNPTQDELDELAEINKYLTDAKEDPIAFTTTVPQKTLFRALMHSLIKEDKTKLPKDRNFKMYDLLTELLGIDLDIPTFASWYLGWHDTGRPAVLLQTIKNDNRPGGLREAMPAQGIDEKNTGTSWAERERRIRLLMQMVMKAKFGRRGRYFNYPGHDTKGAGVKDVRNYLNLMYGTSRDTSWLNDLLDGAIPLEQEFTGDHGLTRDPITQYVGMAKGGDEVIFAKSGYAGLIENPRDFKAWVKRTAANVENSKRYTSGDKEGYALMNDGPLSGGYLWRDYNLNIDGKYVHHHGDKFFATHHPDEAIKDMRESTYRAGIDLAAKTIAPLIGVMKNTIDSTQGKNPGSARFANTLLWYAVSKWMDTSWEFREKPGYAVDANLHTARYFMHQYLLEYGQGGLIYDDQAFDEIMLGAVRKADGTKAIRYEVRTTNGVQETKDKKGKWVSGKTEEGLIDAFPKQLRDQILAPHRREIRDRDGNLVNVIEEDYWLPFGLRSKYPETMANYFDVRERQSVRDDYKGALSQRKPREKVKHP